MCVTPPPVPVIVITRYPTEEIVPAVTVMVEVPAPGAGIGFGLKVTVWRGPCPEAVKLTPELKPRETVVVTVKVVEAPLATYRIEGDALMVKSGPVTANITVVVSVIWPAVPVSVML